MPFSQIIGHQKQLEILRLSLERGRLHHAYLFVGPEGVGKRTIAVSLAEAIHCAAGAGDFCGQCSDCARIQDGNHPDVRIVQPLAGKKEISIQQVRELEKSLNFRSFSGRTKVAIVEPATLMNLPAQNALLKTLEEPPQDSLLILLAASTGGLLPTLRSRCLRLSFGPLEQECLANFLASTKGINKEDANLFAALAMGSMGAAMQLDSEKLREDRRRWTEWLSSIEAGDCRAAVDAADALAPNPEELQRFLGWAASWYRDLMLHAISQDSQGIINLDLMPRIERESARGNLEGMLSVFNQISRVGARIQRNLNRRMVLEELFFNVARERR